MEKPKITLEIVMSGVASPLNINLDHPDALKTVMERLSGKNANPEDGDFATIVSATEAGENIVVNRKLIAYFRVHI